MKLYTVKVDGEYVADVRAMRLDLAIERWLKYHATLTQQTAYQQDRVTVAENRAERGQR